jgi:NhaP-type Na+/H+ or K+/H+ antiporter
MALVKVKDFPRLGALIFGEGVLNDALSIVLFKSLLLLDNFGAKSDPSSNENYQTPLEIIAQVGNSVVYQLAISILIGLSCALANARLLILFSHMRRYPVQQTTLVLLSGYFAYAIAEAVGVSGILTLFVAAVTLSK